MARENAEEADCSQASELLLIFAFLGTEGECRAKFGSRSLEKAIQLVTSRNYTHPPEAGVLSGQVLARACESTMRTPRSRRLRLMAGAKFLRLSFGFASLRAE